MGMIKTAKENISSNSNFWQKLFTGWDWQKVFLAIFTTLTASGLGLYQSQLQNQLNNQQFQLTHRVEQDKLVGQMVERVDKYLNMSKLEDEEKAIILISLIEIVTDTHLEEDQRNNRQEQAELVRGIPFYVALLSENNDALVTIGSKNDQDVSLWVKLAKQTSNTEVRLTAARALQEIFYLTEEEQTNKQTNISRATILNHFLALTPEWPTKEEEQIFGKFSQELYDILKNVLENLSSEEVESNDELKKVVSRADKWIREWELANMPNIEDIAKSPEKPVKEPFEIPQIIQQYRNTLSEKDTEQIKTLIEQLKNNNTATRRSARSTLGALGQKAVPKLLSALEKENNVYRIRLGVVTALLLMEQPVTIPPENIGQITELLGDNDSTIRTNTANFLIKLSEPKTQENVVESLIANLDDLTNENKVYNSVVVLGELKSKVSNSVRKTIQEGLQTSRDNLSKDNSSWTNTIRQIEKYLS